MGPPYTFACGGEGSPPTHVVGSHHASVVPRRGRGETRLVSCSLPCVSSFGWLVLRLWMQTGQVCRSGSLPAKRSVTVAPTRLRLACGALGCPVLFLACAQCESEGFALILVVAAQPQGVARLPALDRASWWAARPERAMRFPCSKAVLGMELSALTIPEHVGR